MTDVLFGIVWYLEWILKVTFISVSMFMYFWAFKNIFFVLIILISFTKMLFYQVSRKQVDESVAVSVWIHFLSKNCPKTLFFMANMVINQLIFDDKSFFKVFFSIGGSTDDSHRFVVYPIQIWTKPFVEVETLESLFGSWKWFEFD